MYQRHELGKVGENLAVEYLKKQNYQLLERNFRCKRGEIDIIAKDKQELIFIEVKTRTNKKYGKPADAVTTRKKKHIYKAAEYYLAIHKKLYEYVRIDVIEVYEYKNIYYIHHIKQVM